VRRRPGSKLAFTLWAAVAFAFLYLPILVMVVFAFNKPSAATVRNLGEYDVGSLAPDQVGNVSVWNGFTTGWFAAGLQDPTYIPAIVTSLQIAFASAIISTILGLMAALALTRMRRRWRAPFDVLAYMTLVVPEIVIAVAYLIFFVQAHLYVPLFPSLGRGTILLGQIVFNASLAMLIIRARFVGMGDVLEEASYDLGAGRLSTFRQVTLPRLMPAVVAAWLLAFTFSFDDYIVPAFTNGTVNTWPIVLYSAVRFGITPAVNALATLLLAVNVVLIVIAALVLRRSRPGAAAGQEQTKGLAGTLGLGR